VKSPTLLQKCELVLGVAVGIGCLLAIYSAGAQLFLPFQLDYAEGVVLDASVRLSQGETPYPPAGEPPYVFNQYGPLFYSLVALVVRYFGIGFASARLLGLFSGLLVAVLLGLLLRRWTGSARVGLFFGGLYLTFPVVHDWLFHLRPDFLGLAFALAGLYIFSLAPHRWYFAVPLFVAAVFCKYTLVAAPGACFLYLLSRRKWRKATWLAASMGLLVASIFVWLQQATDGWFAFHMFGTHPAPLFPLRYLWFLSVGFVAHLVPGFLATVLALHQVARRRLSLALIYWGVCFLTTFTLAKVGADLNHLVEWLAALCLCAGLGYHWLRTQPKQTSTATVAAVALALLVLVGLPRQFGPPSRRADCVQAYDFVKTHPGRRMLSDNVGALVMGGKPVLVSDPFVYGQLVRWGGWSDPVQALVRSRSFDAIILSGDIDYLKRKAQEPTSSDSRWPLPLLHALEKNYQPVKKFVCTEANVVFEPIAGEEAETASAVSGELSEH